jgi:hypothetical protein
MHFIRWDLRCLLLGGLCVSVLGCSGGVAGSDGDPSVVDGNEGAAQQGLNGNVVYPDTSCNSANGSYKNAIESAVFWADAFVGDVNECLKNGFLSYTTESPNIVFGRIFAQNPTKVRCAQLPAGSERIQPVADDEITFDYDTLSEAGDQLVGDVLHAIAHTKGYGHSTSANSSSTLAYARSFEYANSVPERAEACGKAAYNGNVSSLRGREDLVHGTTLAPSGGMGGSPYEIQCGYTLGLQVRAGTSINAIGPMCLTLVGGSFTPSMAGGNGGTAATLSCPSGQLMVGVDGYDDGSKLVGIGPLCLPTQSIVDKQLFYGLSTVDAGGSTGEFFYRRCPGGQIVTALRGRSGALVDRLELDCSPVDDVQIPDEAPLDSAGGTGGDLKLEKCAGRSAMTGLVMQADTRVRRLGATCAETTTTCSGSTCTDTVGSARHLLFPHGGTSGQVAETACGSHLAMVGVRLRVDTLVNAAGPLCAVDSQWSGSGDAPITKPAMVGGTDGTLVTLTCPRGRFMSGWQIRTGAAVDAVRPVCRDFK